MPKKFSDFMFSARCNTFPVWLFRIFFLILPSFMYYNLRLSLSLSLSLSFSLMEHFIPQPSVELYFVFLSIRIMPFAHGFLATAFFQHNKKFFL